MTGEEKSGETTNKESSSKGFRRDRYNRGINSVGQSTEVYGRYLTVESINIGVDLDR